MHSDRTTASSRGLTAFGVFLLWGAAMASLAGTTFVWRGTVLDRVWVLNPRAYKQLAPFGSKAGIAFLFLAVVLAAAGVGWFRRRQWAWMLATAILVAQVLGDLVNLFLGRVVEGAIGIVAAGALLFYLLSTPVRSLFSP